MTGEWWWWWIDEKHLCLKWDSSQWSQEFKWSRPTPQIIWPLRLASLFSLTTPLPQFAFSPIDTPCWENSTERCTRILCWQSAKWRQAELLRHLNCQLGCKSIYATYMSANWVSLLFHCIFTKLLLTIFCNRIKLRPDSVTNYSFSNLASSHWQHSTVGSDYYWMWSIRVQ
jgi:hypothetical protein